jgi:membrane-associated phospholipid phosphatase
MSLSLSESERSGYSPSPSTPTPSPSPPLDRFLQQVPGPSSNYSTRSRSLSPSLPLPPNPPTSSSSPSRYTTPRHRRSRSLSHRKISLLDLLHPEKQQLTQVSRRRRLLHTFEVFDQQISARIHSLILNPCGINLEPLVLVPALLFSAWSIPILLPLAVFLAPSPETRISLILGSPLTLAFTSRMKHWTRRIRPGIHAVAHRQFKIRSWERTNAMPSGDSAQAALWCVLLARAMGGGHSWALLLVVPCTMFARVYFGCHWVGDTLVGAAVGAGMAAGIVAGLSWACGSGGLAGAIQVCG